MDIEFDPHKDEINTSQHQGISLTMAANLEWGLLQAEEDRRRDYGEVRMIGYAPIDRRIYCVIYTDRGNVRRIISLRKANRREVKKYASQI